MSFRKFILLIVFFQCTYCIGQSFEYLKKKDGYVFKQKNSDKLVESIIYYEVGKFSLGFCPVSDGINWGVVNSIGEEILPLIYEELTIMRNELFKVKIEGKFGVVNKFGEIKIEPEYSHLDYISWSGTKVRFEDILFDYDENEDSFFLRKYNYLEFVYKVVNEMPILLDICDEEEIILVGKDCRNIKLENWLNERIDELNVPSFFVILQFIVNEYKEIEQVEVYSGKDQIFLDDLIKIAYTIPVYKVGRQKGRAVSVKMFLPIRYKKK